MLKNSSETKKHCEVLDRQRMLDTVRGYVGGREYVGGGGGGGVRWGGGGGWCC